MGHLPRCLIREQGQGQEPVVQDATGKAVGKGEHLLLWLTAVSGVSMQYGKDTCHFP